MAVEPDAAVSQRHDGVNAVGPTTPEETQGNKAKADGGSTGNKRTLIAVAAVAAVAVIVLICVLVYKPHEAPTDEYQAEKSEAPTLEEVEELTSSDDPSQSETSGSRRERPPHRKATKDKAPRTAGMGTSMRSFVRTRRSHARCMGLAPWTGTSPMPKTNVASSSGGAYAVRMSSSSKRMARPMPLRYRRRSSPLQA